MLGFSYARVACGRPGWDVESRGSLEVVLYLIDSGYLVFCGEVRCTDTVLTRDAPY